MADTERILGDITVLELSPGISGAYCGKLLAALGARVIAETLTLTFSSITRQDRSAFSN